MDKPSKTDDQAGRPIKLTPEIQRRLCDALRTGNTRTAAAHAGIGRATFIEWMRRGQDPRYTRRGKLRADCKEFVGFVDAVTREENVAQVRNVTVLQKAATGWPVKKTTTKSAKKFIGKGEDGKPVYATEITTTVVEYVEHDWRAALEWLQRRHPKQWGLRLRIEQMVEDELTGALDRLQTGLDPETYDKVLALISEE